MILVPPKKAISVGVTDEVLTTRSEIRNRLGKHWPVRDNTTRIISCLCFTWHCDPFAKVDIDEWRDHLADALTGDAQ